MTPSDVPAGHPVDVMLKENIELKKVVNRAFDLLDEIEISDKENISEDSV